jgi:hypothetical protein
MDDFNGLAQRVALSGDNVHGCLILSRDGLVLGAYPTIDDSVAKSSWLKFAKSLGEPERGFVEFPDQVWVFARRGVYSAFAVGGAGIRPGVLLETVEQALMAADQSRVSRDALRIPDAPSAPTGKPRTSLHPQASRQAPEHAAVVAEAALAEAAPAEVAGVAPSAETFEAPSAETFEAPSAEAETSPEGERGATPDAAAEASPEGSQADPESHQVPSTHPTPGLADPKQPSDDDGEVDRVMLAQEFSGLLQMGESDDEGSS